MVIFIRESCIAVALHSLLGDVYSHSLPGAVIGAVLGA